MSTSTTEQSTKHLPPAANSFDQFVSRCLDRAGSQVKLVDLATSILLIIAVTLVVLLAVCLVDGWVLSLPAWCRLAILSGLLLFAAVVLIRSITPLVFGRISPAYAARMIEQSEPRFKNSLLNYVFLRGLASPSARRVYEAVQAKAAQDLSGIAIESAIDRSNLIRVGFALVGIVAACAAYKLLSPKDPFTSVARVVAPLGDIQPPSRVRIEHVEPGNVDILFGETIDVVADVRGVSEKDPVVLVYSTSDGQRVGAIIPLQPGSSRYEYTGRLSTSDTGIQQSLKYWVAAGDGRSKNYFVQVQPSPTITVSQIELVPPAYTGLPTIHQIGQPDIEGIDGTGVHLEALANQPIASATLELLKAPTARNAANSARPAVRLPRDDGLADRPADLELVDRLPMIVTDRSAHVDFNLLRVGAEQKFTHYRLKFTNQQGHRNRVEPLYSIRIKPDLAPEIEVLEPSETKLQLPVNGALRVRVRALDPDFRITVIRMIGMHKGKSSVSQDLYLDSPNGTGNVIGQFVFRPAAWHLQPGDVLLFHFVAMDNWHSPLGGQLEPNKTRSANYELTIGPSTDRPNRPANRRPKENRDNQGADASSDESQQPNQAEQPSGQNDDSNEQSGESDSKQEGGQSGRGDGQQGNDQNDSQSSKQNGSKGNSNGAKDNSQPPGESNDGGDPADQRRQDDGKTEPNSSASAQPSDESNGNEDNSEAGNDSQAADGSPSQTNQQQSDASADGGGQSGQPMKGEQNQSGDARSKSNSAGNTGRDSKKSDGGQPNEGDRTENNPSNQSQRSESNGQSNKPSNGSEQPASGRDAEPRQLDQSSHDGERFEKLLDHLNRKQKQSGNRTENQFANQDSSQNQSNGAGKNDRGSGQANDSSEGRSQAESEKPSDDRSPGANSSKSNQSPPGSEQAASDRESKDSSSASDNATDPGQGKSDGAESDSQSGAGQDPTTNSDNQSAAQTGDNSRKMASANGASGNEQDKSDSNDSRQQNGDQESGLGGGEQGKQSDSKSANGSPAKDSNSAKRGPPRGDQSRFPDERKDLDDGYDMSSATPEEREQLERTEQVTELVVKYLKDHQVQPDQDLLDEMNWTEQELRDFVKRWENLKQAATPGNKSGELRYAEALRSLGLQRQGEEARQAKMQRDELRDLNEDGSISQPPEKFAEAFRDFSKGRAKQSSGQ